MSTELIKTSWIELSGPARFEPSAITDVIKWVTDQARTDLTPITAQDRKEIASMAAKVARSKVFIDNEGKELVAGWKRQSKAVDVQRKRIRDELDDLKAKVREPLTNWENAERERVEAIEARIEEIVLQSVVDQNADSETIAEVLFKTKSIVVDDSFAEFQDRAHEAKIRAIGNLSITLVARGKFESDQEELEKLRKESEQRAIKDREEIIARNAAADARIKAEAAAKAKADEDRLAIERAQAELAAAEARTKRAKEQHAAELVAIKARQEQAETERLIKVNRIRIDIENEAKVKAYTLKMQKENEAYQAKIQAEAIHDLEHECEDISYDQAELVYATVLDGKIRHMEIT